MSWKWVSFGILCLVLLFQYKNISSFVAVELALKGFKELDVNSINYREDALKRQHEILYKGAG